jgi:hypothetical protein
MLRALTAAQRRVLLAHEDAHVRRHHQLFIQATELAAAANPVLRPAVDTVRETVERWADEAAARDVGSRALVAHALAQAALARADTARPEPDRDAAVLEIGSEHVVARARAMLGPAPRSHRMLTVGLVLLAVLPTASALRVGLAAEAHFEQAHAECVATAGGSCAPAE